MWKQLAIVERKRRKVSTKDSLGHQAGGSQSPPLASPLLVFGNNELGNDGQKTRTIREYMTEKRIGQLQAKAFQLKSPYSHEGYKKKTRNSTVTKYHARISEWEITTPHTTSYGKKVLEYKFHYTLNTPATNAVRQTEELTQAIQNLKVNIKIINKEEVNPKIDSRSSIVFLCEDIPSQIHVKLFLQDNGIASSDLNLRVVSGRYLVEANGKVPFTQFGLIKPAKDLSRWGHDLF